MNFNFFAYWIGFFAKKLLFDIVAYKGKTAAIFNIICSDKPSFGHLPIIHLFGHRQDTPDIVLSRFYFNFYIVPAGNLWVYFIYRRTLNLNSLNISHFRNNRSTGFVPSPSNRGMTWYKNDQIFTNLAHSFPHQIAKAEAPTQENHNSHNPPDYAKESEEASKSVCLQILEGLSYYFGQKHNKILG